MNDKFTDISLHWPAPHLSLDNAAMIAALAYHKESVDPFALKPETRIPF